MKFKVLLFVSLLAGAASCKKSSEANKICCTRTQSYLKIENNTNSPIYFSAFGQNILPSIDWIPTCNNNVIPSDSAISVSLSSILGYKDNDKLVVYWWACTGNNPGQMQNVILDKNQTACK